MSIIAVTTRDDDNARNKVRRERTEEREISSDWQQEFLSNTILSLLSTSGA